MAGNNSIQFVRGSSSARSNHTEVSLIGQPIFETDTNKLYVGDGETPVNELTAVKASTADNVESTINNKSINDIFEDDGVTAKEATHATEADTATHATEADTATNVTGQINGEAIASIFEDDGMTIKQATTSERAVYLNGKVIPVTLGGELSSAGDGAQIELFATGTASEQLSVGSALEYNGEIAEITEFDGDTYTLACKKDGEFYSKLGQQINVLTLIDYEHIISGMNPEILYAGSVNSGSIQLSKPLAVGDKIRVCYGGDYQYFTITRSINTNTPTVTKTILKQLATGAENFANLQIHSVEMVMSVGQKKITLKPIHTVIRLDSSITFAARVEKISLSSDFSITEIARIEE